MQPEGGCVGPTPGAVGAGRIAWVRCLLLLLLSPALFVGRIEVLSGGYTLQAPGIHNPVAQLDTFLQRAMSAAWVQVVALGRCFLPLALSHEHNTMQLVTAAGDWRNAVSAAAWVVALGLLWLAALCGGSALRPDGSLNPLRRSRRWRLLISLALMVLPFLPASHALIKVGFVVAERQMVLPSLGAVLLAVELAGAGFEVAAAALDEVARGWGGQDGVDGGILADSRGAGDESSEEESNGECSEGRGKGGHRAPPRREAAVVIEPIGAPVSEPVHATAGAALAASLAAVLGTACVLWYCHLTLLRSADWRDDLSMLRAHARWYRRDTFMTSYGMATRLFRTGHISAGESPMVATLAVDTPSDPRQVYGSLLLSFPGHAPDALHGDALPGPETPIAIGPQHEVAAWAGEEGLAFARGLRPWGAGANATRVAGCLDARGGGADPVLLPACLEEESASSDSSGLAQVLEAWEQCSGEQPHWVSKVEYHTRGVAGILGMSPHMIDDGHMWLAAGMRGRYNPLRATSLVPAWAGAARRSEDGLRPCPHWAPALALEAEDAAVEAAMLRCSEWSLLEEASGGEEQEAGRGVAETLAEQDVGWNLRGAWPEHFSELQTAAWALAGVFRRLAAHSAAWTARRLGLGGLVEGGTESAESSDGALLPSSSLQKEGVQAAASALRRDCLDRIEALQSPAGPRGAVLRAVSGAPSGLLAAVCSRFSSRSSLGMTWMPPALPLSETVPMDLGLGGATSGQGAVAREGEAGGNADRTSSWADGGADRLLLRAVAGLLPAAEE